MEAALAGTWVLTVGPSSHTAARGQHRPTEAADPPAGTEAGSQALGLWRPLPPPTTPHLVPGPAVQWAVLPLLRWGKPFSPSVPRFLPLSTATESAVS